MIQSIALIFSDDILILNTNRIKKFVRMVISKDGKPLKSLIEFCCVPGYRQKMSPSRLLFPSHLHIRCFVHSEMLYSIKTSLSKVRVSLGC